MSAAMPRVSGPWPSRWTADVSGLLHITRHHTDSKETL